jgi:hypothetical protein
MPNHPIQSPSYHGRYPRSMEQAFGDGARLEREATPIDWTEVIGYGLCCLCVIAMVVLLCWRG